MEEVRASAERELAGRATSAAERRATESVRDAVKEALEAYRGAEGAEGAASSSSPGWPEDAAALDEILAKLKSQDLVPACRASGPSRGTVTAKLDAERASSASA